MTVPPPCEPPLGDPLGVLPGPRNSQLPGSKLLCSGTVVRVTGFEKSVTLSSESKSAAAEVLEGGAPDGASPPLGGEVDELDVGGVVSNL
eukprot:g4237.t1